MTDLRFLLEIKEFLSSPNKWTQGRLAKGASGEPRGVHSEFATCWCLVGAGEKVIVGTERERAYDSLSRLLELPNVGGAPGSCSNELRKVAIFNDDQYTDFALIHSVLDAAIAKLATPLTQASA